MKKIITIILISMFCSAFAQEQPKNRFENAEEQSRSFGRQAEHTNDVDADNPQPGPGNPGDPVPIDMYIPFLMLTAAGIIVYVVRKKSNALS